MGSNARDKVMPSDSGACCILRPDERLIYIFASAERSTPILTHASARCGPEGFRVSLGL